MTELTKLKKEKEAATKAKNVILEKIEKLQDKLNELDSELGPAVIKENDIKYKLAVDYGI